MESDSAFSLTLVRGPNDLPLSSQEFQKELSNFAQSLREQSIQIESRSFAFDAVHGGGGLSGEFILVVTGLGFLVQHLERPLTTYLKGHPRRKVRAEFRKDGKLKTVEAQGADDVERIIRAAAEYWEKTSNE